MQISRRTVLLGILALACLPAAPAQTGFYLHDGDRVVFYGDSITDQRLYTTFVETYVVTRFPKMHVTFVHSGWGGDRVTGGGGGPIDLRLARDVVAYKPNVMTIMLGMNDGSYRSFDRQIFETYATGYQHIIQSVKESLPGIRITVIEPSPFDDVTRAPNFEGGYNKVMVRYGAFVRELAEKEKLTLADMNTPLVAALEKADKLDAENAKRMVPDRVHPGPAGHLLMAEALLKAWQAPATVASVEIDAADSKVVSATNTSVTDLKTGEHITWSQTDDALPLPIDLKDPVASLALRASDFMDAMDREPLRVTGLTAARYTLKIDDGVVGSFSKEELAAGVNLAAQATPMMEQAATVHDLTVKHNTVHFARWRQVQVPLADIQAERKQAAMDALDALDNELIAQQRAAAQPKPHRFELTAQ